MNDAPVARQSRGTARPQAGESTLLHQHPVERLDVFLSTSIRKGGRFAFFVQGNWAYRFNRALKRESCKQVSCIKGRDLTRSLSTRLKYHKILVKSR